MWVFLLSRRDDPPGTCIERRQFDGGTMTVGRSDNCDWTISDPDMAVSREHLMLEKRGLDLFATDKESTNGVQLNSDEEPIAPNQPIALKIGDRLTIGDFVIEVANSITGRGAQPASELPKPPEPRSSEPIGGSGMFSPPPSVPPAPSANGGPRSERPSANPLHPTAPEPARKSYNPFEDLHTANADREDPSVPFPRVPFPLGDDAGGGDLTGPSPFTRMTDRIPENWEASSGAPETLAAQFSNPFEPLTLPQPENEDEMPAPPADEGGRDAIWQAFCAGAGLDPAEVPIPDEAGWEELGVFYQQVVLGLSELIRARAVFKSEFRIEATQFAIGNNNPIKWLDPKRAAELLLQPPRPGFIDTAEAAYDAFRDLKRHQLAMLSGVQQVHAWIIEDLAPEAIEREVESLNRGKWLFGRGAAPWAIYRTRFQTIQKEGSNSRGALTSAFRRGYERFFQDR